MSGSRSTRRARRTGERLRRDPRAERQLQSEAPAAETPRRVRRDPRALRAVGMHGTGQRLRIDRAHPLALVEDPPPGSTRAAALAESSARRIVIEDPACWVLAVLDLDNAELSARERDLLGAARVLADVHGGAVIAVVFEAVYALGDAGADRVLRFELPERSPETRAAAVVAAIDAWQPRHVLFADVPTGGGDLGRRVAATLSEMPAAHVRRVSAERIASRGNGGRSDFVREPPRLLLVDAEAAEPVVAQVHEARALEPPRVDTRARVADLGPVPVDPSTVPLREADFILSAGHGVTDWPAFHALAAALGASEAGSRVVCDAGLLARARQVGASGTLVEPRCYIAVGISGAPQHLQGIARCQRVVAINNDPHCEMVKRAELAVIADAQQVMAALTRLLEDRRDD